MRNLCSYKNSCDVLANSVTFPDNCSGEQKILKVWYQCVGTGKFTYILTNFFINKFLKVITTGGNANGKPCRFPFKYNNIDHYQCTYEDYEYFNNKKWCRTNNDTFPILEWGNCPCKYFSLVLSPIIFFIYLLSFSC
jgi:hypothetical protein